MCLYISSKNIFSTFKHQHLKKSNLLLLYIIYYAIYHSTFNTETQLSHTIFRLQLRTPNDSPLFIVENTKGKITII